MINVTVWFNSDPASSNGDWPGYGVMVIEPTPTDSGWVNEAWHYGKYSPTGKLYREVLSDGSTQGLG